MLADAAASFCAAHVRPKLAFSRAFWRSFCERGLLALGTPEGEGGLRAIVAACEPLASAIFPGPLVDAFIAVQLVSEPERAAIIAGEQIVVTGRAPHFAFGEYADALIDLEGEQAFYVSCTGPSERVEALGEEAWLHVPTQRERALQGAERALCIGDVVLATYLAQAALTLVKVTAEHAQTRKQFGKPIGAFQAVSQPLASSFMALSAAARLSRAAACSFDEADLSGAQTRATGALVSSRRAALEASYVCHQKLGAIGITTEGPAHFITSRIRNLATRATDRISLDRLLKREDA
jgi:alkylation response protein AidB-like acyl-CoA dehydrogenase